MTKLFSYITSNKRLILFGLGFFYTIFLTVQLFSLINKTYAIEESKLYKIDSVNLMSKAFGLPGGKGASQGFEFDDEKGFNYTVSNVSFSSIKNKKLVKDSFRYSTLVITVYTDESGINTYTKGLTSRTIEVFQFAIGNTKHIDLKNQNRSIHRAKQKSLITFTLLFIIIFTLVKKDKFVPLIQRLLKPPAPALSSPSAASQSKP